MPQKENGYGQERQFDRRRIPMRPVTPNQEALTPTASGRARIPMKPPNAIRESPEYAALVENTINPTGYKARPLDYTKAVVTSRPGETPGPHEVDVWASHAAGKTVLRGDK